MTDERRSRTYARRRDLREAPLQDPFTPGPTTQELELYRSDLSLEHRGPDLSVEQWREPAQPPGGQRGERARAFVERWSLWAAGLGRPPRDPSGRRHYPRREGMLVPGLFIAAGLGIAGMVGLLTGVLVTGTGGDAAAAANTAAPTVTVTQKVTLPAVTETRTRTRTKTATVSVTQVGKLPTSGSMSRASAGTSSSGAMSRGADGSGASACVTAGGSDAGSDAGMG